jgi:hypothetical protein
MYHRCTAEQHLEYETIASQCASVSYPAFTMLTRAQRRVLVAVRAALGVRYHIEWIASEGPRMNVLLIHHERSQRSATVLFDNPETCTKPKVKDCVGVIANSDKRAAEIAALASTSADDARALIQDSEPGEATDLHHVLDAALMALDREGR